MEAQRDLEAYREKISELEQDNAEFKAKYGDLHEENDRLRKSLQVSSIYKVPSTNQMCFLKL